LKGRRLGRIEEDFITHLREGERFVYAGKTLRFVGIKDLTALVTPARGAVNKTPIWAGTKLPISESLAASVRRSIARMAEGRFDTPELEAFREAATIQSQVSILPREHDLLIELTQTREGRHCSILAFEGRFVNSAIGAILALRLARRSPTTFSVTANDYGVELLTSSDIDLSRYITPELFDSTNLVDDAFSSVRYSELAKVQFREIARVSGLVVQNYPGTKKSGRMVGASSTLIFDVLSEFDPEHVLIKQAYREVLERQFERSRLARTLERLRHATLMVRHTASPTPLSFPIFVERMAAHVSVETIEERLARMQEQWRTNPQKS
ncbi:MAG: DNA ligase-associated DEXH box helicase, partial [Phycisphaerales bacterium]